MKIKSKLLLFDLDDTLLNSEKFVSQANVLAISKCKSTGMIIGYITARSPRKVKTYLKDLPCDCISYYNGASIVAENILLEKNEIPYVEGIKTMSEIQTAYPDIAIGAYLEPYNYFNGQIQNISTKKVYSGTIQDLALYDIQRIRVVTEACKDVSLDQFITSDMKYLLSINGSAIITSKRATKENAVRKFGEYFNIDINDIVAFGDDTNDIGMIKTAGIGVAMGNAIDELKSVADFVCDTNDNDGVAKWINHFLL
ncbi:MAG: HAD-IIB family hydrolase [Clostridium sp.]|uniref:HAD-IIB family hydrolase n=1 Tax=Clostridium sp. TaxID=1506 RepID=UPI003D6CD947